MSDEQHDPTSEVPGPESEVPGSTGPGAEESVTPPDAPDAPDVSDVPDVPRSRKPALVITLLVVCVLAVAVMFAPIPITIDSASVWVPQGTTVASLISQGRLARTFGDLLSVKGKVLRRGGGGVPTVHVNGEPATATSTVGVGTRLTSVRGTDFIESTKTVTVETTLSPRFVGHGPALSMVSSGTPSTTKVVVGAVSGKEVSRRLVSSGEAMVVRLTRAHPKHKEVALTFDDGPWPNSTDAMLGVLKKAHAKATFFMIGRQVKARAALAKRVLAAGMEIGAHSYSHKLLARASLSVITSEIAGGADAIHSVLGITPRWYRPAGGSTNASVYAEAKRIGLHIVEWSVDPHDYTKPGAKTIAKRVLKNVSSGSVVLMHDGGGNRSQTVAALKIVLRTLKKRGYKAVTLSELYGPAGTKP
jgi:peptidoglycan/xylan/chitin deacetylase (PgdA/CDA1 family)